MVDRGQSWETWMGRDLSWWCRVLGKIYDNLEVSDDDKEFTPDSFNPHIGMELLMDRGGNEPETAKVVKRLRDKEGNLLDKSMIIQLYW